MAARALFRTNSLCAWRNRVFITPSAPSNTFSRLRWTAAFRLSTPPHNRLLHFSSTYFNSPISTPAHPTSTSRMATSPPYNDLTYYTFGTPNGLKPAIVLEELGLTYKVEKVDISKNTQKEEWYLAINPNGRIPALKDGDLRVFETGAIMLYLTDHYDKDNTLNYPQGSSEYYEVMSWLMWQMGGLGPMQGQANHFRAMAGVYSEYGIKRYMDETKRLFDVLESRLSKADWLAGNKYTIADIASYSWVRAAPLFLDIQLDGWPGIDKWVKRIAERSAVQKAQKIPEGTMTVEELMQMGEAMRNKIDAMKETKRDS